jgi:integrase
VKHLYETLAPSTVAVVHCWVAVIFAAAVRDRRIATSPCVGTTLPRRHKPKVEPLATDAVHALANAMPGRYRAVVMLAAGTGLRQGECFGLDLAHIDFLRRQIRVEQQLVTIAGLAPSLGPPKTDASIRAVPLPTVIAEGLAAHVGAYPPGQWGLVFTTPAGAADLALYMVRAMGRVGSSSWFAGGHQVPRSEALLRVAAHPPRRECQDGSGSARACERQRNPRHVLPLVARLRGPYPRGG